MCTSNEINFLLDFNLLPLTFEIEIARSSILSVINFLNQTNNQLLYKNVLQNRKNRFTQKVIQRTRSLQAV